MRTNYQRGERADRVQIYKGSKTDNDMKQKRIYIRRTKQPTIDRKIAVIGYWLNRRQKKRGAVWTNP